MTDGAIFDLTLLLHSVSGYVHCASIRLSQRD